MKLQLLGVRFNNGNLAVSRLQLGEACGAGSHQGRVAAHNEGGGGLIQEESDSMEDVSAVKEDATDYFSLGFIFLILLSSRKSLVGVRSRMFRVLVMVWCII